MLKTLYFGLGSGGSSGGGGGGGTVVSVALTLPNPINPAFSVTGSPITSAGTFTITANGTSSQYIDGTGALQTFPTLGITADNGLTANTSTNVQLGGTTLGTGNLIRDSYITNDGYVLRIDQINSSTNALDLRHSGTGLNKGTGLNSITGGISVRARSSESWAYEGVSFLDYTASFLRDAASNNDIVGILKLVRNTTATPFSGIGGSIDFWIEERQTIPTPPPTDPTVRLIGLWENPGPAVLSRLSRFDIFGYSNGGALLNASVRGDGAFYLYQYGVNTFAGTPTYALGVDASGNVVEFTGGGGTVTSVALTLPNPINPAFSVTGSPITSAGTFTITANGTSSQYIDGTGALQNYVQLIGSTSGNTTNPSPIGLQNETYLGLSSGASITALYPVCIGWGAGGGSTANVQNIIAIGRDAGSLVVGSSGLFNGYIAIGTSAGRSAINAYRSNMIGAGAGRNSTGSNDSLFQLNAAGENAISANDSCFIGNFAGRNTTNLSNTVAIGLNSCFGDILALPSWNIVIGANTRTGGFSRSVVLGSSLSSTVTNTRNDQFMLVDTIIYARWRGIEYEFPSSLGLAGAVLTDVAGNGVLSWVVGGGGGATLTNTYIGYGDASNNLTGDSNLTYDFTNRIFTISGQATFDYNTASPIINLGELSTFRSNLTIATNTVTNDNYLRFVSKTDQTLINEEFLFLGQTNGVTFPKIGFLTSGNIWAEFTMVDGTFNNTFSVKNTNGKLLHIDTAGRYQFGDIDNFVTSYYLDLDLSTQTFSVGSATTKYINLDTFSGIYTIGDTFLGRFITIDTSNSYVQCTPEVIFFNQAGTSPVNGNLVLRGSLSTSISNALYIEDNSNNQIYAIANDTGWIFNNTDNKWFKGNRLLHENDEGANKITFGLNSSYGTDITSTDIIILGNENFVNPSSVSNAPTGSSLLLVGLRVGQVINATDFSVGRALIMGIDSGNSIRDAADSLIIGFNSGNGIISGIENTFVGHRIGNTHDHEKTTAMGYDVIRNAQATSKGVFIGSLADSETPLVGTNEEKVVVGYNAKTRNFGSVAIGASSTNRGVDSNVIGRGSGATGGRGNAIGYAAQIGGNDSNALGWSSSAQFDRGIVFGSLAATIGAGQVVFGSESYEYANYFFGRGVERSGLGTLPLCTFQTTNGNGSNIDATTSIFRIQSAKGTGTGKAGLVEVVQFIRFASGNTNTQFTSSKTMIRTNDDATPKANLFLCDTGTGLFFFDMTGTPATKQTVTGSRGGNAALASLLTALANYGLITDSTTA